MAILGVLLLVGGVIAYSLGSSHTADCYSGLGQLGRAFSAQLEKECQNWEYAKTGGVAGIVGGALFMAAAFLSGFSAGLRGGGKGQQH